MSCLCCCGCICKKNKEDEDDEQAKKTETTATEDDFITYAQPVAPYPTPSKQSSSFPADGDKEGFGSTVTKGVLSSAARWIAVYEGYRIKSSDNFRAAADTDFNELLIEAETAIENEVLPQRIHKGSSGSYFVKNSNQDIIGVFKPRDEEPYGSMNPKWAKWFQRHCCCCCFGRGCIVPNTGYLSEAGASLVDIRLGLNIVPRTKVIRMASTTFHYGNMKRKAAKAKQTLADKFPAVGRRFHRIGLPLKVGSFQVYVNDYKDALVWLDAFHSDPLPPDDAHEFQLEFERMVILDYVIRNTDRGNDNWLVRYEKPGGAGGDHPKQQPHGKNDSSNITLWPYFPQIGRSIDKSELPKKRIKIAAIDNGLAFPFKHPDEWRAYPFHWARLPQAKLAFSSATRDKFLPKLSDINEIEELCSELYCIFSMDKNFQKNIFEKQMSVLRGQVLNLANALRDGKSPYELVQMRPIRILREVDLPAELPKHASTSLFSAAVTNSHSIPRTMKISPTNTLMFDSDEYKPEIQHEQPVFRSW